MRSPNFAVDRRTDASEKALIQRRTSQANQRRMHFADDVSRFGGTVGNSLWIVSDCEWHIVKGPTCKKTGTLNSHPCDKASSFALSIQPAGWCRQQLFLFPKRWLQSVPYQYHSKAYHNYHNVSQSSETRRLSFISAVASRQNFLSIRPTAVPSQLSHTKGTTTTAPRRIASTEPGRCADSELHEGLNTSVAQAGVLASRTWRKPPNRDKVDGRCGRLSTRGNSIWQR